MWFTPACNVIQKFRHKQEMLTKQMHAQKRAARTPSASRSIRSPSLLAIRQGLSDESGVAALAGSQQDARRLASLESELQALQSEHAAAVSSHTEVLVSQTALREAHAAELAGVRASNSSATAVRTQAHHNISGEMPYITDCLCFQVAVCALQSELQDARATQAEAAAAFDAQLAAAAARDTEALDAQLAAAAARDTEALDAATELVAVPLEETSAASDATLTELKEKHAAALLAQQEQVVAVESAAMEQTIHVSSLESELEALRLEHATAAVGAVSALEAATEAIAARDQEVANLQSEMAELRESHSVALEVAVEEYMYRRKLDELRAEKQAVASEPDPDPEPELKLQPEPDLKPEPKPEPEAVVCEADLVQSGVVSETAVWLAKLAAKTPPQSGDVSCQFGGSKKSRFERVFMELTRDGSIAMKETKDGMPSQVVLRTASAVGCSVSELKNVRKGHSYAFRLDIVAKDSKGEQKYVLSVDTDEEKTHWMAKLGKWSELTAESLEGIAVEVAAAEAAA